MDTTQPLLIRHEDFASLPALIKPYRRVFFWGEMGVGKSTLAVQLLHQLTALQPDYLLLELDPGTPPFGVPGTICIGKSINEKISWANATPLCTLNSARFRLPLVLAARQLLNTAKKLYGETTLLIDPPGVIRGVGGAELLIAFKEALQIDAIIILCKTQDIPLKDELAALSLPLIIIPPSTQAGMVSKTEKMKWRTRLWEEYLAKADEELFDIRQLNRIGTPPPIQVPEAWQGRQLALLDKNGASVAIGEVLSLSKDFLTAKAVRTSQEQPTTLLVRDAGRTGAGYLATVTYLPTAPRHSNGSTQMHVPYVRSNRYSPPVSSHMGPARATLMGGVFGDPLLHVRLRNQQRSFLFDLGVSALLTAKIIHQTEAVFLSHAHLDHIGGFIWFLRCRIGQFGPCRIFGPEGTIERVTNLLKAIIWDRIDDLGPIFEVAEIESKVLKKARLQPGKKPISQPSQPINDGIILATENFTVRAVICDHNIPSIAYSLKFVQEISIRKDKLKQLGLQPGPWLGRLKQSIDSKKAKSVITLPDNSKVPAGDLAKELAIIRPGKKLAYVTDIADTEENRKKVINLARGAHTLFCETAFTEEDRDKAKATQHLTTSATAQIASSADVVNLVPFHFSKRYELNPNRIYQELSNNVRDIKIIGSHN